MSVVVSGGTITPLELKVAAIPMTLNQWGRDWRGRKKNNEAHYWLVFNAFGTKRRQMVHMHGPWFPGAVDLEFTFYVPGRRTIDLDNLIPKSFIDAMKGVVFRDDNIDVVRSIVMQAERIGSRQHAYTRIVVSDARDRS